MRSLQWKDIVPGLCPATRLLCMTSIILGQVLFWLNLNSFLYLAAIAFISLVEEIVFIGHDACHHMLNYEICSLQKG